MEKSSFSPEEMKQRFEKFGIIYLEEDIKEEMDDLIGLEDKKDLMSDFFLALKKYQDISSSLAEAKITPNFTMLLYGPPGTGKTALTRAMCRKYSVPIGLVEADRLVSPLLGDTIKNIRGVFDLASEFVRNNGPFVLFFDELDAVTGERANVHEVGEIKRAVITFLQVLDKVNYEGIPLAIFGATNHQSQLDSAVWRRFTYHLKFDFPNFIVRKNIIESFLERIEQATIGIDQRIVSNLEDEYQFLLDLYNQKKEKLNRDLNDQEYINMFNKLYNQGKADILYATQGYTGADIMRGTRVALLKAIQKSMLEYEDFKSALSLVGGTKKHVIHGKKMAEVANNKVKSNNSSSLSSISESEKSEEQEEDDLSDLDIDL